MSPNILNNGLPAVMAVFACGFVPPVAAAQTRAIPDPVGMRANSTSSQASVFADMAREVVRSGRIAKIRGLRGKYKGLLPSVEEYLHAKRQEAN